MKQKNPINGIFPAELNAVIDAYADIESVEGILLFGSRAMGWADSRSDCDLYVVCGPKIPSVTERKKILKKIKGIRRLVFESPNGNPGWIVPGDKFNFQNYRFDCGYQKLTWLNDLLRNIRKNGPLSLPQMLHKPYTILGLLENSIVLYDKQGNIAKLLHRTRPFPPALKQNLIREGLRLCTESLAEMNDYNRRDIGNTAFLFHLTRALDAICSVLFAANEKYDPATKRVEKFLETLTLKPTRFMNRYHKILSGPFTQQGRKQIIKTLHRLISDLTNLPQKENTFLERINI